MEHTKGPWKWEGEDYRGDWGWQILVGPKGEGIIVGDDNGKPSKHLKGNFPVDPELCITGMRADEKDHVNAVHVFSPANARLIVAAPDMIAILKRILDGFMNDPGIEVAEHAHKISDIIAKIEGRG